MTLSTAMAISGAAANPWAASAGVGLTRNRLIGTLMALMNLRLGYWVPNPREKDNDNAVKRPTVNHFRPGLDEVIGRNLTEASSLCLLSDGGHFENLALYELIRRRVRLILLCDGTADPNYDFSDLQNAMFRIGEDFGATIQFPKDKGELTPFMPALDAGYPHTALLSPQAYAVAEIRYADGAEGKLIYINTALIKGLKLELLGYKCANWDFPDQSTGDQFFDEAQFRAYQELGYAIAETMIENERREGGALTLL